MRTHLFEINRNGALIGPFEYETIVRMMNEGMLTPEDFFRARGQEAWRPMFMFGESETTEEASEPDEAPSEAIAQGPHCSRPQLRWLIGLATVALLVLAITAPFWRHQRQLKPMPDQASASVPNGLDRSIQTEAERTEPAKIEAAKVEPSKEVDPPEEAAASLAPAKHESASPSLLSNPLCAAHPGEKYRANAEQGDSLQQALLADALMTTGWSAAQFKEAADWAEKSAQQGNPLGKAIIAEAISKGIGRDPDFSRGLELSADNAWDLVAGADAGGPVWQRWAAKAPIAWRRTFPESHETPAQRDQRQNALLEKAAEGGDLEAAVHLADETFSDPNKSSDDKAKAMAFLRVASN